MVEQLDMTFAALADPTRRAMLANLMSGERSVGELAAPFAMSFAGAAKHVAVLERAGLVERRKAGRQQFAGSRPTDWPRPINGCGNGKRSGPCSLDRLEALIGAEEKA